MSEYPAIAPGWEQQHALEPQRWQLEKADRELRALIRSALVEGARFEELQECERKQMTAQAIRAADPAQAWKFLQEAPEAETYPHLIADALAGEYGGYLGLERTRDPLLRAILAGAMRYAEGILETVFEEELTRRGTHR